MGKNYFRPEQVEQLRRNKYVKHVSEKAITYTEEFKKTFMLKYNSGKPLSQIIIVLCVLVCLNKAKFLKKTIIIMDYKSFDK